jgi:hypothetical protein
MLLGYRSVVSKIVQGTFLLAQSFHTLDSSCKASHPSSGDSQHPRMLLQDFVPLLSRYRIDGAANRARETAEAAAEGAKVGGLCG